MPLLGRKKIYLIDEAHMLSKAAFNALLKILEEPPASVLFILATTDVPKVPATVLSRCFQVIFSPIENTDLRGHLKSMCERENISIDDAAIDLIIAETEGSARDAINLLERVRFSQDTITQATILSVLGKVSLQELCALFNCLLENNPAKVLIQLNAMKFESISAQNLWDMLIELCRALLWIRYGIKELKAGLNQNFDELSILAKKCSLNRLHAIFQLLWSQEELFLKTAKKHIFLEMVLLQICEQTSVSDLQDILNALNSAKRLPNDGNASNAMPRHEIVPDADVLANAVSDPASSASQGEFVTGAGQVAVSCNSSWSSFLKKMGGSDDPMLNSILVQAKFIKFDETSKKIDLQLSNGSRFFKDKIEETKEQWLAKLQQDFDRCIGFNFIDAPIAQQPVVGAGQVLGQRQADGMVRQPVSPVQSPKPVFRSVDSSVMDIKDGEKWPLANLIFSHFPGVVKKTDPE
jgi:DNA polymerase-3 subunit gamma/tau